MNKKQLKVDWLFSFISTFLLLILFGGIIVSFTNYSAQVSDVISWLALSFTVSSWLLMHLKLSPDMEIKVYATQKNLLPGVQIGYRFTGTEMRSLRITIVIDFVNRSGTANSIIDEEYMIINSRGEVLSAEKRYDATLHPERQFILPDTYNPYGARRCIAHLFVKWEDACRIFDKADHYWVQCVFTPINGSPIKGKGKGIIERREPEVIQS